MFLFSFIQGLNGGTTVAGTVIVSSAVGIKVFATGIILVNGSPLNYWYNINITVRTYTSHIERITTSIGVVEWEAYSSL